MDDKHHTPIHDLTPHEQAQAQEAAWKGFVEQRTAYNPPPHEIGVDAVIQNRAVTHTLTRAIGCLPVLLLITMAAAIIVSLDKTSWAFEQSVANTIDIPGIGNVWMPIVALAAIIMTDVALAVSEFEMVRQHLEADVQDVRRYWTLMSALDGLVHRIGFERVEVHQRIGGRTVRKKVWRRIDPAARHHIQHVDPTLKQWNMYIFWMAVAANVFAIFHTANITSLDSARHMDLGAILMLVVGLGGVISIQQIGRLVARVTFRAAQQEQHEQNRELRDRWLAEMRAMWDQPGVGEALVTRALHNAFLKKNKLSAGTQSPYLLMAGEDENGEAAVDAIPFEKSSEPSQMNSPHDLSPDNGHQMR